MRGYIETKSKNNITDSIESWTKKQCLEYLRDYPNGLSADFVRERLKVLEAKEEPISNYREIDSSKNISSSSTSAQSESNDNNTKEILFILALFVLLMVCAYNFDWSAHFVIMIIVCTLYSLGKVTVKK